MPKTNALLPDMGADAVNAVMSDAWKSIAGLQLPPSLLGELQRDYLQGAAALWNQTLQGLEERIFVIRRQAIRRQGMGREPGRVVHRTDVPAELAHAGAHGRGGGR